jgi:hypothetical protein
MKKSLYLFTLLIAYCTISHGQISNNLYGIVRKNYYTNQTFDSATVRLGSVNTTNGYVSNIGNYTYQMGINLTGGAALNPYDSTYIFIGSTGNIITLHLGNGQIIHQAAVNNPVAISYFDNFRFCNGDSTIYGLARRNYFDSTLNINVGQLLLAKINTLTGTITQISQNSIGQGYALAGSAIDPYQMIYYYSTGSNLVGVDMYSGTVYSNTPMQLPTNANFDNFTYSCADTALYGLVRSNYYSPVVPFPLDSSTVRLGKINPTTGVVTILSSAALFGEGYSLNAGSAIDPITMTYYYNTGAFLVGASLYNGQQNSIDSIQFADGMYFDLMRNFDNCLAINIIRTNNSTGISEINQDIISIAPNPASSEISIKSEEMFSQINIYSTQGNIVYTEQLNANESTISINELNEGLYIVQIRLSNGKTINKRIIKQ